MTKIKDIPLTMISVPASRARSFDPLKAQALAGSIDAQGLFNPIMVRVVNDTYELVSGLHRLRAFERLGRTEIAATVTELDDAGARLAEVMENLARAELIALDRCQHLFELKQTYEQMYPEATRGGDRKSENFKLQSLQFDPEAPEVFGFAEHVAEHIGLSQRTIYQAVKIWNGLALDVRPRLYGTDLARKQTELKALSELPPAQQTKVLDLIFDEFTDVTNVAGALAAIEGGVVFTSLERQIDNLRKGLAKVSNDTLDLLIAEQADRVIASLQRMGRI